MRVALVGRYEDPKLPGFEVRVPRSKRDYDSSLFESLGEIWIFDAITFADYHVVIVDLVDANPRLHTWLTREVLTEGAKFLQDGGTLVFLSFWDFPINDDTDGETSKRLRTANGQTLLDIVGKDIKTYDGQGDRVYFEPRHPIARKLNELEFGWAASFSLPDDVVPIGRNAMRHPVAFERQVGKGLFVLLPRFSGGVKSKAVQVKAILEYLESRGAGGRPSEPPPTWVDSYHLFREDEIRRTAEESQKWLRKVAGLKALLYGEGIDLLQAVETCLRDFQFGVSNVEKLGRHDLEIRFPEQTVIAEVTGRKGQLTAPAMRELMDHYLAIAEEAERLRTGKRFKGVFFVNPFRDIDPRGRGAPASGPVLETAERQDFAIVPTPMLFQFYSRYIENLEKPGSNEVTPERVKRILLETKGLVQGSDVAG